MELDRDNFMRRWEAEQQSHKDTIDRYNADKKSISSISQANQIESRGQWMFFHALVDTEVFITNNSQRNKKMSRIGFEIHFC